MSGRKGMLHCKAETKQEAGRLVLEECLTYAAVAARHEICKTKRITAWVRMYRREGELSFHKPIGRPVKTEREEREVERLRMENALLKKFHTELRKVGSRSDIRRSTTTRRIRSEGDV
jgi:transposase-like protein